MTELIGGPWDGKDVEKIPAIYCRNKVNNTAVFWRVYMDMFIKRKFEYMAYKGITEQQFYELAEAYKRTYIASEQTFNEVQGLTND